MYEGRRGQRGSVDSSLVAVKVVTVHTQFVEQLDITENSLFFGKKSMRFKSGDPLDIFFIQNGNFRC
jgi:hypothetical protein